MRVKIVLTTTLEVTRYVDVTTMKEARAIAEEFGLYGEKEIRPESYDSIIGQTCKLRKVADTTGRNEDERLAH